MSVPPKFGADHQLPDVDDARLVEESFAFLLVREPADSIMKEFDLPMISRYFPGYIDDLRRRLQ
ncbi:MAG: hypothetical protein M3256_08185 [Actinomycetota bacterium]|nr:hypothetical protein [Actinomycetota bacterium]